MPTTTEIKNTVRTYSNSERIDGRIHDLVGNYDYLDPKGNFNSSCILTIYAHPCMPMMTISLKMETRCKLEDRAQYIMWVEEELYEFTSYEDMGVVFTAL